MTAAQSRAIAETLRAWMDGSTLVDDLIPRTQAILDQLAHGTRSGPGGALSPGATHGAKRTPASCQALDTAAMSDAELRAYYKRTAPVEDVRFHLRRQLSPELRDGYTALLAMLEASSGKASVQSKAEYKRLQQLERESFRVPIVESDTVGHPTWTVVYAEEMGSAGCIGAGCCVVRPGRSPKTEKKRRAA